MVNVDDSDGDFPCAEALAHQSAGNSAKIAVADARSVGRMSEGQGYNRPSIAARSLAEFGEVRLLKTPTTLPSRSMRYL